MNTKLNNLIATFLKNFNYFSYKTQNFINFKNTTAIFG